MKYVGLVLLLVGVAVLVLFTVVLLVRSKVVLPRRAVRREAAIRRATWQVKDPYTEGESTMVVIQKLAADGNWSAVLDQQFIGKVALDRDDYPEVLDRFWAEALRRTYQLNTGPLM